MPPFVAKNKTVVTDESLTRDAASGKSKLMLDIGVQRGGGGQRVQCPHRVS